MKTARFVFVPFAAALIALASTFIPASASSAAARGPVSPVTITDTVDFATGLGSFTATGIGACTSGVSVTELDFATLERGRVAFDVVKIFFCDSGGDFVLHIVASVPAFAAVCPKQDTGDWFVLAGDGPFAAMTGAGSITGTEIYGNNTDCSATGVVDHYRGVVSNI